MGGSSTTAVRYRDARDRAAGTLGRLGANDDRLLILTADLLGMCHASNVGVYESLRSGLATGAGLMVPGPMGA